MSVVGPGAVHRAHAWLGSGKMQSTEPAPRGPASRDLPRIGVTFFDKEIEYVNAPFDERSRQILSFLHAMRPARKVTRFTPAVIVTVTGRIESHVQPSVPG